MQAPILTFPSPAMIRSLRLLTATTILLLMSLSSARAQDVALEIGDPAPAFSATDVNGEPWHSQDVLGEKTLIVYFYPAAMTGGCTKQACAFRDHRTTLTELGAEVVGVSGDRVENLQVFKQTHNLNFPLLSDADGAIARAFGVPVRDGASITRTVDGEEVTLTRDVTAARWTFIVDRDGRIIYKNTEVNPERDSAEVIAVLRAL